MKRLLVINSSAKSLNSRSRKLTGIFAGHWKSIYTDSGIRVRELGNAHVPHINETWIAAAFKPEAARSDDEIEALRISDKYIAELREADIIVIGAPMYNWSIPSALKAYIDQVLRVNETFRYDPARLEQPYVGLLEGKRLLLLLSRGDAGYGKGEYNEHMDFQGAYLKTVFNIMGISNIQIIALEGTSARDGKLEQAVDTAHSKIREVIELLTV